MVDFLTPDEARERFGVLTKPDKYVKVYLEFEDGDGRWVPVFGTPLGPLMGGFGDFQGYRLLTDREREQYRWRV